MLLYADGMGPAFALGGDAGGAVDTRAYLGPFVALPGHHDRDNINVNLLLGGGCAGSRGVGRGKCDAKESVWARVVESLSL